jgi:hypothetical protein
VLEKQERSFAGADGKILLYLFALLPAEGRIGHNNFDAVFFLNVGQIFGERVDVQQIGRFDAVQDHVHDPNHVGKRLLFLAVEGPLVERVHIVGGEV